MRAQPTPQQNTSLAVIPPPQHRMPWRVTNVKTLPNFRLAVQFVDGTHGTADLSALVHSQNAGVFAPLANTNLFAQAYVKDGCITWPGEIDIAPDALYAKILKTGTAYL